MEESISLIKIDQGLKTEYKFTILIHPKLLYVQFN